MSTTVVSLKCLILMAGIGKILIQVGYLLVHEGIKDM